MRILKSPADLASQCREWRKRGETVALAPTMGYYHEGHKALMARGRELGDRLVVSLFVNPAQFGPNEDLDAYPRDFERDRGIAEAMGADVLFAPDPADMYLSGHATWVEVPALARGLCGGSRPTHFRGVCTIVLKLFMLTNADYAVFGQKDWQQQAIIRRMAADLNIPIQIVAVPTAREKDGLALSSRNVYLTAKERAEAPQIRRAMLEARDSCKAGERDSAALRQKALDHLQRHLPSGHVEYLSIVDPESLEPLGNVAKTALMACAVRLGNARLIDNILLEA